MTRTKTRKNDKVNANTEVEPDEWRMVVDLHLGGATPASIAAAAGREEKAIEVMINRIATDYDEGGERESPLSKLRRADLMSTLDPNREFTLRDREYWHHCKAKGRTTRECMVIFNLSEARVEVLHRTSGLPGAGAHPSFFPARVDKALKRAGG